MIRRQLTMFLAGEPALAVEAVRRIVDPEQYRLIPAHVTLAHPRNPRAPGNSLEAAQALPPRWQARLAWIHLIEQEGAQPWRRLAMFDLSA